MHADSHLVTKYKMSNSFFFKDPLHLYCAAQDSSPHVAAPLYVPRKNHTYQNSAALRGICRYRLRRRVLQDHCTRTSRLGGIVGKSSSQRPGSACEGPSLIRLNAYQSLSDRISSWYWLTLSHLCAKFPISSFSQFLQLCMFCCSFLTFPCIRRHQDHQYHRLFGPTFGGRPCQQIPTNLQGFGSD